MLIPLARGVILILRLPLLVLIGVGALVVFAATRIDDWLRSWRSSFVCSRSVVAPWSRGRMKLDRYSPLPQPIVARKLASS